MENYSAAPKSFVRRQNTSFRDTFSIANCGAGTFVASSPSKYANASTKTAIDTNLQHKPSTPTLIEPKHEPDVFAPIRQPRLPDGPGFAPRNRVPHKVYRKFYIDPKTNNSFSDWKPGMVELYLWRTPDYELSVEDLNSVSEKKSCREEMDYLNHIRQVRRVNKMCNAKDLKASSDIKRHENTYLDQIKQIRKVQMLCPAESSNDIESHENMFLVQIKQIRRVSIISARA